MILEIACFNFESAAIAEQAGADRIELCENYSEGGVTPGNSLVEKIKSAIKIPVHAIIRPRGGNFIYSNEEFQLMKSQIEFCKSTKLEGIVFGILKSDNTIDEYRCKEIVDAAKPLSATFIVLLI